MSRTTGIISEIREFCLHDGPGVRTTVFFKGCPLRCLWCHNPELRPFGIENINGSPCGEVYTVEKAAERILRDREILVNSGGGVTFSGGEVLSQVDFASELAHELGNLHIAVETSGMSSRENYQKMLDFSDLVYQDIKCMSSSLHKKLTQCDNEFILDNIRLLQKSNKPYIIRIVLVPDLNDSSRELESAAKFLSENPGNLQYTELLPYHGAAVSKLRKANLPIPPELPQFDGIVPDSAKEIFRKYDLPCK